MINNDFDQDWNIIMNDQKPNILLHFIVKIPIKYDIIVDYSVLKYNVYFIHLHTCTYTCVTQALGAAVSRFPL